jgi:hypothetical protein
MYQNISDACGRACLNPTANIPETVKLAKLYEDKWDYYI